MDMKKLRKAMAAAGLTGAAATMFTTGPAFAKCKDNCTTCQTCSTCVPAGDEKFPICRISVACGQSMIAGELKPSF